MKNTEKQKEAAAQHSVQQPRAQPRSSPLVAMTFLYRKQFHGGPPCPCDAGFIMTKGRMEKQGEHFCLHFLRGCAILLYTDECISPRAIVAQLDRAFGSDPEGQRFESSRSHQEKPRHNVPGLFFFLCDREDSNSTALRSRVSNPFYPLRFFCQMRYRPSVIRVSR